VREMYNTSVPVPFKCFSAVRVVDPFRVERAILNAFGPFRASGREFLRIDPIVA
jgi:hypothetical protein